jgi:hypothetical protein
MYQSIKNIVRRMPPIRRQLARIDTMHGQLSSIGGRISELSQAIGRLQISSESQEAAARRLGEELTLNKSAIEQIGRDIDINKSGIVQIGTDIDQLKSTIGRLAADLDSVASATAHIGADIDALKRMVAASSGNSKDLALYAITSMGRSGSTLLRNELIKSPDVCCLASGDFLHWLAANHQILAGSAQMLRERQTELREQWVRKPWFQADVRYRHALSDAVRNWSRSLGSILLCKDALYVMAAQDPPVLHNFRFIHLVRDPVAVALSYSNINSETGKAFVEGGGRSLRNIVGLMRRFVDGYAPQIQVPDEDELAAAPSHIAAAHLVGVFYRALAVFLSQEGLTAGNLLIRFEDLCAKREQTLARIHLFMGLQTAPVPDNAIFFKDGIEEGGIQMAQNTSLQRANRIISDADDVALKTVAEIIGDAGAPFGYSR